MSATESAVTVPIGAPDVVDDLFWRAEYAPITEDDAFLEGIVAVADLPSLLTALAAVTQDLTLLREELRPPLPLAEVVGSPHGGMSAEAQAEARALALAALQRVRDEGLTSIRPVSEDEARELMLYITNGADERNVELLSHELDLSETKLGAPTWSFDDIAAGRDFSVAVIGTGMSGIAAMYRLKQAGVPFTAFEKNPEVGGTWWTNTYPGVRLDTPTFGYSYSFAQRADWPSAFAQGGEIQNYALDIVERADLRRRVEFETEVVAARWNESSGRWDVTIQRADGTQQQRSFNAIISAVGQLDRPNIPVIDGQDVFQGAQMHSARWNHDVQVAGKKVAVIGTGASAYQIVPNIIDEVDELVVFQRSSPWMIPAPNYYDDTPDAVKWLGEHVPYYGQWLRFFTFWQGTVGRAHTVIAEPGWDRQDSVSPINLRVREALTDIIAEQWRDRPELLEKIVPSYPPGGKRMLRDNGVWAGALQRPHAELVTTGISHFTPRGIVTDDGVEHEVDVVIYATGFLASDYLDPMDIRGLSGQSLRERWQGDAKAFAGISVPDFPNLYIVMGPNTGYVVNGSLHFMIECAAEFTVEAIHQTLLRDIRGLEVRQGVVDEFVATIDAANATKAWGQPYVRTWYKNSYGRVSQIWPYSMLEYWQLTRGVDFDAQYIEH